ncbi:MAG: aspartate kinase [Clostridia bacterium]|nr:aspartate kinase [Oscillospiraceae bacterium]MBQ3760471.1 aspartate kinase [Clostridia bacterium]
MARYVLKFGGSSLADPKKLYAAAKRLAALHGAGHQVVGVLSAQGGATDALLAKARQIDPDCGGRELDALLATGEQASVCLCAMALRRLNVPAVSLSGWQAGLRTEPRFGDAHILGLANDRIARELAAGNIVLVTGFQGVNDDGDVTTLGRGGSDTTAVALAAFLHADHCKIYTDVDGVYTADPRTHPDAVKYDKLSYDDMLALSRSGAKVLHDRCVELAKQYQVKIEVLSAASDDSGTVVGA